MMQQAFGILYGILLPDVILLLLQSFIGKTRCIDSSYYKWLISPEATGIPVIGSSSI